jgi:hypothetical protein
MKWLIESLVVITRIVPKLRMMTWKLASAQTAKDTQLLPAKRTAHVVDVVDVRKDEEYAAVVLRGFLLAFMNGEMDILIHTCIFFIRFDCFDASD